LSFVDLSCDDSANELSIQQEFNVILNCFKEVDITGKVQIKNKLHEIAYPDKMSLDAPKSQVNTKKAKKGRARKLARSTKRNPSYFEHVNALCSQIIVHLL